MDSGSELGMLLVKAIILGVVITGILGFVLYQYLSKSTYSHLDNLKQQTDQVRNKQSELNEKIKQASEELNKRRAEADALVGRMKNEAETTAQEEREKIIKKARSDSEEILNKAHQSKAVVGKELEKQMHLKAVDFSILVLKEILSTRAMGGFNENMISEFLDNLENVDMSLIDDTLDTADVITAAPLDKKSEERLLSIIKNKMNRDIKINNIIDKKIINGIVLKFGSLSLNGGLVELLKDQGVLIKEKLDRGLLKDVEEYGGESES